MKTLYSYVVCSAYYLSFPMHGFSWQLSLGASSTMNKWSAVRIAESAWRQAAHDHSETIRALLRPGLLPIEHHINPGRSRRKPKNKTTSNELEPLPFSFDSTRVDWVTSLDPQHPIYNFLIEYYGLKGAKGVRRLIRWSPDPRLMLRGNENIQTLEDLQQSSNLSKDIPLRTFSGIMLEGAKEQDFVSILQPKGTQVVSGGVTYSPSFLYQDSSFGEPHISNELTKKNVAKLSAPFLWYQSILLNTLDADPILHCYGLHEWAMQYQPQGAKPPPSAKYQKHLPLRVSRQVLNETVERKGISCTHVDALRFFAPLALPLNRFGGPLLSRTDQPRLEQPACVHATMDLLKMTLKLQPFCHASILQRVLSVALEARTLDVAASPYDASVYGVEVIPIENSNGRAEYKRRQVDLMKRADPVRRDLLEAYNTFLALTFSSDDIVMGHHHVPH